MEELKLQKIQVRNNAIVTTAERYNEEAHIELEHDQPTGLLFKNMKEANNLPKLVQKVINVGPMVRDIQVGDWVFINPLHYLNRKLVEQKNDLKSDIPEAHLKEEYGPEYEFPVIELDGVEHLLLFDRDVEYIILRATEGKREYVSERENN